MSNRITDVCSPEGFAATGRILIVYEKPFVSREEVEAEIIRVKECLDDCAFNEYMNGVPKL